jgi:hypothetical protein
MVDAKIIFGIIGILVLGGGAGVFIIKDNKTFKVNSNGG